MTEPGASGFPSATSRHSAEQDMLRGTIDGDRGDPADETQSARTSSDPAALSARAGLKAVELDPAWQIPSPYGAPLAVQSLSTVAAPLLAGFSVTLSGVIMQAADQFKWPGTALLLLAVATVLFLLAVQCGFWARHWLVLPEEATQWWSDFESSPGRRKAVAEEQQAQYGVYRRWANAARSAYNSAIVALLAGVAIALVPIDGGWDSLMRWIAAAVFGVSALGEIVWWWRASR